MVKDKFILIASIIILIGAMTGGAFIGKAIWGCKPQPDLRPQLSQAMREAIEWEGQAKVHMAEGARLRALREAYERSLIPVKTLNKKNLHAIRSAGFNAAIDTLDVVPRD